MDSHAPSLRTILIPQRAPTEPYSIRLDPSERRDGSQGMINTTLVDQINQELYDLAIIKNSRLLDSYKQTIRYMIDQKKKDILEVQEYIRLRNKEVEEYKQKIEELTILPAVTEVQADTQDDVQEEPPTDKDLDCSIEQLLRSHLDRAKPAYELEVINATKPFLLMLTVSETKILIEITSVCKKINDPIINSFKARVKDSEVDCGLFLSMDTGYTLKSGISDFSLVPQDDKYCLFVANVESDHLKFKNAVTILLQLAKKETEPSKSSEP